MPRRSKALNRCRSFTKYNQQMERGVSELCINTANGDIHPPSQWALFLLLLKKLHKEIHCLTFLSKNLVPVCTVVRSSTVQYNQETLALITKTAIFRHDNVSTSVSKLCTSTGDHIL